jgi:YD repeat-containing protein
VRIPVEGDAGASSVAVLDAAARALVFGAALFSSFCYAGDITYGYDALGRLTSVTVAGATAYYGYDAAGNITSIGRSGMASAAAMYPAFSTVGTQAAAFVAGARPVADSTRMIVTDAH